MDSERSLVAKKNFDKFLKEGLIKKIKFESIIFNRFSTNSLESLKTANLLFSTGTSYLWTVVISYYAMFYIASAYIYKRGYKAGHKIVHKVINDALIVLAKNKIAEQIIIEYEEEKEKALFIAEQKLNNYEFERAKRSSFQYTMTEEIKKSKAQTSLNRAKEFVALFRKLN